MSPGISHGAGGLTEGLPPTLEKQITICDFDLPSFQEIQSETKDLIEKVIQQTQNKEKEGAVITKQNKIAVNNLLALKPEDIVECSRVLQGLTLLEVRNAITSSIQFLKTLNPRFLLEAKKQILAKSEILEYWEPNQEMNDVGGLDSLKNYLEDYKYSHTDEAQKFGVEPLRGVLIIGVPGTGKSLTCKALASSWKLPLVRLDVGKVMGSLVGQSEQRMRGAIKQIEAISPALLWIDEVEKALSGTKSSNQSDGGTMSRVFGTLLTAMEEGLKGITILATANDIEALPPELIRRFSEVFYVDLPGPDERKEIFEIHLRKKNQDIKNFELKELIAASDQYTGHEISKSINRSFAFAFKSPEKKLSTKHILDAIEETKPLSSIMGAKISKMREEARDKYRYASSWAEAQVNKHKAKKAKMDVKDIKLPEMKNKTKDTSGDDVALD
jgi:SpoVK/Ycf46/Vps4 family AAA+-type ATPase